MVCIDRWWPWIGPSGRGDVGCRVPITRLYRRVPSTVPMPWQVGRGRNQREESKGYLGKGWRFAAIKFEVSRKI